MGGCIEVFGKVWCVGMTWESVNDMRSCLCLVLHLYSRCGMTGVRYYGWNDTCVGVVGVSGLLE